MKVMNWYRIAMAKEYAPFLESGESAWNWAKENVDIEYVEEDIEEGQDGYIAARVESEQTRAQIYSDRYNDIKDDSEVTIYRAIKVNSINDINWGNVGTHRSFEEKGAGVYGVVPSEISKDAITVVLTGITTPNHIDWEYCFTSFMYYGEDQWECALDEDAPVTVIEIDGKKIEPILAHA